jgi:uncharacterized protein YjbI with pentapeptide repeats
LAGRRQWHNEQSQRDIRQDATERRITDLYTKAADQLGSDKAAVRLAGLYALERVAQDNPDQRSTIVSVLCAYLRMPYTLPGGPPTTEATADTQIEYIGRVQEREVRLAAQSILSAHLFPGNSPDRPLATFWPGTSLNLTGATLIDFNLGGCHIIGGLFERARFSGVGWFKGGHFWSEAVFNKAQFEHDAGFYDAHFHATVWFCETQFGHIGAFRKAQFDDDVMFDCATFDGAALFDGTQFDGDAGFRDTCFDRRAVFDDARFGGNAWFSRALFRNEANFSRTEFSRNAWFDEVQFHREARFDHSRFGNDLGFNHCQERDEPPEPRAPCWVRTDVSAQVSQLRMWPSRWSVLSTPDRPDSIEDGEWGRLVIAHSKSPNSQDPGVVSRP